VRSNPSTRSSTSWRGARRRASAAVLTEIGYGSSRLATVAAVRRSAQRPHATSRPVRCGATDCCQASAAAVRSSVSVYSAPEPKQNGAECIVQRAECIVTRASCVCCRFCTPSSRAADAADLDDEDGTRAHAHAASVVHSLDAIRKMGARRRPLMQRACNQASTIQRPRRTQRIPHARSVVPATRDCCAVHAGAAPLLSRSVPVACCSLHDACCKSHDA
jgi:hypothetical protein